MKIIVNDPYVTVGDREIEQTELSQLLARSDIVSVHVAYTPETHCLINSKRLESMKNGSLLINTSRGEVIDQAALVKMLGLNRIAGAALDVLSEENNGGRHAIVESELYKYALNNRNLLITPHIGGATYESMEKTEIFIAERIRNFLS